MAVTSPRLNNHFSRLCANNLQHEGLELAAAFYVAWPYYRVRTLLECRTMHQIPFTWLYTLRALQAGLDSLSDVSSFLGVAELVVKQWIEQLSIRQVIFVTDGRLILTDLAHELLTSPEVEKLTSIPARLTWDCVRGKLSETPYDVLRARGRGPKCAFELFTRRRIPIGSDVSLAECQGLLEVLLEGLSEEFDGAEIISLRYLAQPIKATQSLAILVYGSGPADYEIKAFADGVTDTNAAAYIRDCPNFGQRLARLFDDTTVDDFLRRAGVASPTRLKKGQKVQISSEQNEKPERGPTFPGQGLLAVEYALLTSQQCMTLVITELQLCEWDSFRSLIADTLERGVTCRVVIILSNREGVERYSGGTSEFAEAIFKLKPKAYKNLLVCTKVEDFPGQWRPVVICDDQWAWCGTEMLPGSTGQMSHAGYVFNDKATCKKIAEFTESQLDTTGAPNPNVKVTIKKKRPIAST